MGRSTQEVNPAARRAPSVPCPSHVVHSPRRADVVAFPVRQEEHLCRCRSRHGVRFRTWVLAWGVACDPHHPLTRRACSLRRLSCTTIVYCCLVRCLKPANLALLASNAYVGPPASSPPLPPLQGHRFRLRAKQSHDQAPRVCSQCATYFVLVSLVRKKKLNADWSALRGTR